MKRGLLIWVLHNNESFSKIIPTLIPCSCGKVYIGETMRRLENRMKEYRDAFEKRMLKLAAAEHVSEEHHPI